MTDGTYPLFSIFSFLGFILPLIPLPWHLHALNSGTCFYIFWSSLACLNQFINSIVWAGNALNLAPVWCEISIRIMMASSVGIPASSLCINRRLYLIASVKNASMTHAKKRRAVLIDTLICFLFPLIYVALQYVVQGHRFNILEDIGCYPALYNTLPTFFITSMWPVLLGLTSASFCCLTLLSFSRRRAEFSQILSANTTFTLSRYFRLMALAMTEICATTPLAIFTIWLNAKATPVSPWISWQDTHFDYSRVEQIPAVLWRSNRFLAIAVEFSRWVNPVCSFIFFAFFGFAQESKRNYRQAWKWLRNCLIPRFGSHISSKASKPHMHLSDSSNPVTSEAVFALPLHELKHPSLSGSTVSQQPSGKLTYLDSLVSTPESPDFSEINTPRQFFYPLGAPQPLKIALYRSRTL